MLNLKFRLQCKHCGKKSIVSIQAGDMVRDITVDCPHCGRPCEITRKDFLEILGNLNRFRKHIKI
ncbi:MAG: hypothetical protein JRH07_04595 [Deltaproteobacteria bacterium]|nr:hypothetical protein [Deltaproteobacteria bacterium]